MIPNRLKRINNLLQHEISRIIREDLKDPRVNFSASVTEVVTSPDLSTARVFVSVLEEEEEKRDAAVDGLNSAANFIQSRLRGEVVMRRTPKLHFKLDKSIERGVRISMLIDQVAAADRETEGNND